LGKIQVKRFFSKIAARNRLLSQQFQEGSSNMTIHY